MQILVNETPFVKNQSVVRSRVKANTSFTNTNVVINSYLNTARLWVSSILAKRCNSHYLLYKWKVKSTIHVMSQFDTIMWTSFFFQSRDRAKGEVLQKVGEFQKNDLYRLSERERSLTHHHVMDSWNINGGFVPNIRQNIMNEKNCKDVIKW